MNKRLAGIFLITVVIIIGLGVMLPLKLSEKSQHQVVGTVSFNKKVYSLTNPDSTWVVVNKNRPLQPLNYQPTNLVVPAVPLRSGISGDEQYLRSDAASALQKLVKAAALAGVQLNMQSGYRSYNFQVALYSSYVNRDGQATAETYSARPGYSEHQTGLAADLGGVTNPGCNVAVCFQDTPEGKWLAVHAYEYGFIIRYTAPKQSVTGYENEPWHVRYVGTALSHELHKKNVTTLEEFFNLPAAPSYPS